jgi:hypothetical protein
MKQRYIEDKLFGGLKTAVNQQEPKNMVNLESHDQLVRWLVEEINQNSDSVFVQFDWVQVHVLEIISIWFNPK